MIKPYICLWQIWINRKKKITLVFNQGRFRSTDLGDLRDFDIPNYFIIEYEMATLFSYFFLVLRHLRLLKYKLFVVWVLVDAPWCSWYNPSSGLKDRPSHPHPVTAGKVDSCLLVAEYSLQVFALDWEELPHLVSSMPSFQGQELRGGSSYRATILLVGIKKVF